MGHQGALGTTGLEVTQGPVAVLGTVEVTLGMLGTPGTVGVLGTPVTSQMRGTLETLGPPEALAMLPVTPKTLVSPRVHPVTLVSLGMLLAPGTSEVEGTQLVAPGTPRGGAGSGQAL